MTGDMGGSSVWLVLDETEAAGASEPARWAADVLADAIARRGAAVRRAARLQDVAASPVAVQPGAAPLVVLASGAHSHAARRLAGAAGVILPEESESLTFVRHHHEGHDVLLAAGADARGLAYALLELADRVAHSIAPDTGAAGAIAALASVAASGHVVERPHTRIRSCMRLFTSDVEDLPWFHDRAFWQDYLTALATDRFNRFHLAFGIGFDFARRMRDSYFYFTYPFLFDVPGYSVRVRGVGAGEQARNLESLRAIARETKRRGLHFQLGVWANVYEFEDSPDVNHPIEGLTPETHAPYCRDAIRRLLQEVPEIDGLTLRIHGESGIPEGSYDFWRTLLDGIATCGRQVEIDMHAKGIDQRMIDLGLETGQPLLVSPKFWAEHMGLPYHQADIRAVERPGPATGQHARLMALSIGSRRFTRYGYADLLNTDRRHGVLFRIWPGTHRLLLWGDESTGRAYGRAFTFGGADGADLFEPLSFSGRRGSGHRNGRNPYADESLWTDGPHDAWRTYRLTYRMWGRLLYEPDADAEAWRRLLRADFRAGAAAAEAALSSASRILPLITTAHHPSAANNHYWPEIYTNQPIVTLADLRVAAGDSTPPASRGPSGGREASVEGAASEPDTRPHPYSDTARPKRFSNVSALDPETFCSVDEYVDETLRSAPSGRYTPADVAAWLDQLADDALARLSDAAQRVPDATAPPFRRLEADIRIECAIGRFFAAKLRAALGYALHDRTGDAACLRLGLEHYRAARAAWEATVAAGAVYKDDLTFGPEAQLRGHWRDRLPAIDQDIEDMATLLRAAERRGVSGGTTAGDPAVILAGLIARRRPEGDLDLAPCELRPGQPLTVDVSAPSPNATARLHYRHVTQAERYVVAEMERAGIAGDAGDRLRATIPAAYTNSVYPLQFFVEVHDGAEAWRWPGLGPDLAGTPYRVLMPA
jgi:hypothetical protein